MARSTDPAAYANCTSYAAALVAAGLNAADGALLRHSADALRVAEDSGDDFAILSAQWARGTILFRAAPTVRRALSAGALVGHPVLLPYLSSRDIRRSASTLPPV